MNRQTLISTAHRIIESAKSASRELTAAEKSEVEGLVAKVRAIDAAAKSSESLLAGVAAADGSNPDPDDDDAPTGTGQKRLSFRGISRKTAERMKRYSRAADPHSKGLVAAGSTLVGMPLQTAAPVPGASSLEAAPRLVDLLPVVLQEAPVYKYLRQVVVADSGAAAPVAPGAVKPTKKLGIKAEESRLRVVAVLSEPIDKYLLQDVDNLDAWVQMELARALMDAIEDQMLEGDGVGENFRGLATTTGVLDQTFVRDPLVTVQYGLSRLVNTGITPAFVALSAGDWLTIQTTRNAGGGFDVGGPIDAVKGTVWGTPVAIVPGLADGDGYAVGQASAALSTDGQIAVEWGMPGDSFRKNEVVARVEGRFQLDTIRPHGIVRLHLAV